MLIDIEKPLIEDSILTGVAALRGGPCSTVRIQKGLYLCGHFNLNYELPGGCSRWGRDPRASWEQYPALGEIQRCGELTFGSLEHSGVCDSPSQFLRTEVGNWVQESTRRFVVSFTCIKHADQPEDGGWRWHKWGEYVGEHDPQHEYLYHERGIEEVYCFHVYELVR